tara:strand:+ start:14923 stop:15768 length:846 start_codon:yes stop_codon:yes gene_type:complete
MKILLLGANGCLGKQFQVLFKSKKIKFFPITRKNFNFKGNYSDLNKIVELYKPNFIINCIALTGLIYCENKKRLANEINYKIPYNVIKLIKKKNIRFIHFSSEAVFEGKVLNKTYNENSIARPRSIYGKTKLKADKCVMAYKNGVVVRIPLLFGPTHKNQIVASIIKKIKIQKEVFISDNIFSTPLYSPILCNFIFKNLLKKNSFEKKKLIHVTSDRLLSLYDLIIQLSKKIKNKDKSKIINVKDEFFKSKINVKPKNLGLKSIYPMCNFKIDFKKINDFI